MKTFTKAMAAIMLMVTAMLAVGCTKPDEPNNGGDNENDEIGLNGHEYVDLGLPSGTLWATCNVGATVPEGYGNYYAWGEIAPKANYSWSTYKYCNGGEGWNTLTKYCNSTDFGYEGFADSRISLLPEDDAATVNWGEGWCIPSTEQWIELRDNTYIEVITINGVNGRRFTASNGNSIFIPAPGYYCGEEIVDLNFDGICVHGWSSELDTRYPASAWGFYVYSSGIEFGDCSRSYGYTVRPVVRSNQQ